MKINVDLKPDNFVSAATFASSIEHSINPMVNSLIPGQWNGQVIPSIYLEVSDTIDLIAEIKIKNKHKVKFTNPDADNILETVTYSGIILDIISYRNNVGFNFIIPNDPFIKNYRIVNSHLYPFLSVERKNITGYQKNGLVSFYAVKYKRSLAMEDNSSTSFYAGARGGLVGYFMYKGLTSAVKGMVKKMEDEVILKSGTLYSLNYIEDGKEIRLGIVCEEFYVESFEKFLLCNWTREEPSKIISTKKKEGCFIATMAYGDYNHPQVLFLRAFRDSYLQRFVLGKKFIRAYYFLSPRVVALCKNNRYIKKASRVSLDYIIDGLKWMIKT